MGSSLGVPGPENGPPSGGIQPNERREVGGKSKVGEKSTKSLRKVSPSVAPSAAENKTSSCWLRPRPPKIKRPPNRSDQFRSVQSSSVQCSAVQPSSVQFSSVQLPREKQIRATPENSQTARQPGSPSAKLPINRPVNQPASRPTSQPFNQEKGPAAEDETLQIRHRAPWHVETWCDTKRWMLGLV